MTLVLALLIPLTSIAHPSRPHQLHWCAALLQSEPDAGSADPARALADAHARVGEAREPVVSQTPPRLLKVLRWLGRFGSITKGGSFSLWLADVRDVRRARQNLTELDEVSNRLRSLADAAARTGEDTIAFAQVIAGQERIERYVTDVATKARELDAANVLGLDTRYRRFSRWFGPSARAAAFGFLTYSATLALVNEFRTHDIDLMPLSGFVVYLWGRGLVTEMRRLVTYVAGLKSARARDLYEDRYDPARTHGYDARLDAVAKLARDGARPLAYASFATTTTRDVVERMLRGTGRAFPAPADAEAPYSARCRVLIDLVSYRDQHGHPVLMRFVRVTRRKLRPNAKPRGRFGYTPGGLAPAGI